MLEELDFSLTNTDNRATLLDEAIALVSCSNIHLGAAAGERVSDPRQEQTLSLLAGLREEKVEFPNICNVLRVTAEDVAAGVQQPPAMQQQMSTHDFFHIEIPLLLIPRSGYAFTQLLCRIQFCPKEQGNDLAIIHDLLPKSEWQTQMTISTSLEVGIDSSLKFTATTPPATANVTTDGHLKASLGPFVYQFRRAKIRTEGIGHQLASWFMEGTGCVDQEDVVLGIMLRVPKDRQHTIRVIAACEARHSFQLFTSDIFSEWWNHFSKNVQSLLTNGCPITATCEWDDITRIA